MEHAVSTLTVVAIGLSALAVGAALGSWLGARISRLRLTMSHSAELARAASEVAGLRVNLERERTRLDDDLRRTIEGAANKAVLDSSQAIVERAAAEFGNHQRAANGEFQKVVAPLDQRIGALRLSVEQLDKDRLAGTVALKTTLEKLESGSRDLQSSVTLNREQTAALVGALKDSKQRGAWGEIALRRIVEMVGMTEHADFVEQTKTDGVAGRPDLLITLPNGVRIPIDAKAPLADYYAAMEATTSDEQRHHFAESARALRARVREVSQRGYHLAEGGVGFAVVFIPMESVLTAALSAEPALLEDAMENGVLLASPVTLVAYLRAFAHAWSVHKQNVNAADMVARAKVLVDRLTVFTGLLARVGGAIGKSVKYWNEAVASYESRLVVTAREVRQLGGIAGEDATLSPVEMLTRELQALPEQPGAAQLALVD